VKFSVRFLYDLGRSMGLSDFQSLLSQLQLASARERILSLPLALGYTGWGRLEVSPASRFSFGTTSGPLIKFSVKSSAEAATWGVEQQAMFQRGGEYMPNSSQDAEISDKSRAMIGCGLLCGYCAGWVEASMTNPVRERLVCVELQCQAKGAQSCSFIIAAASEVESLAKNQLIELNSATPSASSQLDPFANFLIQYLVKSTQ